MPWILRSFVRPNLPLFTCCFHKIIEMITFSVPPVTVLSRILEQQSSSPLQDFVPFDPLPGYVNPHLARHSLLPHCAPVPMGGMALDVPLTSRPEYPNTAFRYSDGKENKALAKFVVPLSSLLSAEMSWALVQPEVE